MEASRIPGWLWPEGPLASLKCDPHLAQVGRLAVDRAEDWFAMEPWVFRGKQRAGTGSPAGPPGEAVSLPSWRRASRTPSPPALDCLYAQSWTHC